MKRDDAADADPRAVVEAVFRIERARLIAGLARSVRDVGLAEDLAQDALVQALAEWPARGVPENPAAWLTTVARRRAIDRVRHGRMSAGKLAWYAGDANEAHAADEPPDSPSDAMLGLIYTACHPVLPADARTALTLRLVCGLSTGEIARAFLTTEPVIAQRIVRAKAALRSAGVPYEVPHGRDREARLPGVLEVVYLLFNEGYSATRGHDLVQPQLCAEACRLGRVLAATLPDAPDVHGLLALMELQASRLAARTAPDGTPVPITRQDRTRWDRLLIARGLAALRRAEALGGASRPYALQAALAACHARAAYAEETDWRRIAALYDRLREVMPSAVVDLNRAVAHGMAFGPAAGLELLDELQHLPVLRRYAPLPAARGDCLRRLGREVEARAEFLRAADLAEHPRERAFFLARAGECE